MKTSADTETEAAYRFALAPHASPFGAGPEPGTVWDSKSWLAMLDDMIEFEAPLAGQEDEPVATGLIYFRVYSAPPPETKPTETYAAQADVADPLIALLAEKGVEPTEMSEGTARELSVDALRRIDPGLLSMTEDHGFYFLDVGDVDVGPLQEVRPISTGSASTLARTGTSTRSLAIGPAPTSCLSS
ncbi:MAG: hypothetical protein AAF360_08365 [Pseudomonadota bacterium]